MIGPISNYDAWKLASPYEREKDVKPTCWVCGDAIGDIGYCLNSTCAIGSQNLYHESKDGLG